MCAYLSVSLLILALPLTASHSSLEVALVNFANLQLLTLAILLFILAARVSLLSSTSPSHPIALNEKTFNQRSNERWIFRAYRNVFTRNTDCNLSLDNVQKVTVGE
jgi:hypothetical protein